MKVSRPAGSAGQEAEEEEESSRSDPQAVSINSAQQQSRLVGVSNRASTRDPVQEGREIIRVELHAVCC